MLAVFAAGQNRHAFGLDQNRGDIEKGAGLIHVFVKSGPRTYVRNSSVIEGGKLPVSSSLLLAIMPRQGIKRTGIDFEVDPEAGSGGFLRADFGFRGAPSASLREPASLRGEPRRKSHSSFIEIIVTPRCREQ